MTAIEPDAPIVDETAALGPAACLFNGFSDASRLAILRHLALGEHRVVDLTRHLGLAQSTVSKHLACLRDCGLVESRPQGRASVFRLTHPEALMDLLRAAERLLELTGDAVALCPTYGAGTATSAASAPAAARTRGGTTRG
nr:metalloregulator ArsR/SmtB family transcription factor [Cellulomonas endophytica]